MFYVKIEEGVDEREFSFPFYFLLVLIIVYSLPYLPFSTCGVLRY